MKKVTFVIYFCLGALVGIIFAAESATKAPVTTAPPGEPEGEAGEWDIFDDFVPVTNTLNEEFDCNLFKQLTLSTPGNMLVSPLTVKLLLTLLYEGAYGETKAELQQVLQLPENPQATRELAQIILNSLKVQNKNYVLNFSSRMYLRSDIGPRQRFAAIIKQFYQTELYPLHVEKGAAQINDWVSEVTKGKINQIVTDADIQNVALLLINALYFKGNWRSDFPTNQTYSGEFSSTSSKKSNVEYMNRKSQYFYNHNKDINAQFLRIPYKGQKFSMMFVLPDSKDGLPQLIKDLTPKQIRSVLWLMDDVEVNVTIPKFKFESTSYLTEALQAMGLTKIFSDEASLPGLARGVSGVKKLMVSKVLQKTAIEVNEQGSVASAATEIVIENKYNTPEINFKADHPFIFFIQDETTGVILFIGKVQDPLAGV